MNKLLLSSVALLVAGGALADGARGKADLVGTWVLNGTNKSVRFVFNKDGTFAFVAPNASSKGKWSPEEGGVRLVWTEIDKQRVAPGKVKALYKFAEDGSLQVMNFKYRKP